MFPQYVLSKSRWLALVFAGCLSACAVGPDFKQPEAPKTSSYTETTLSKKLTTAPGVPGGTEQEFIEGADIEAGWWELYKSPELDVLIKKALQQNPNLGAADAALRAAQENVSAQSHKSGSLGVYHFVTICDQKSVGTNKGHHQYGRVLSNQGAPTISQLMTIGRHKLSCMKHSCGTQISGIQVKVSC